MWTQRLQVRWLDETLGKKRKMKLGMQAHPTFEALKSEMFTELDKVEVGESLSDPNFAGATFVLWCEKSKQGKQVVRIVERFKARAARLFGSRAAERVETLGYEHIAGDALGSFTF